MELKFFVKNTFTHISINETMKETSHISINEMIKKQQKVTV